MSQKVRRMNQKLYDYAENAYQKYREAEAIVPELLYVWLLAEVHFAGTVTGVQSTYWVCFLPMIVN